MFAKPKRRTADLGIGSAAMVALGSIGPWATVPSVGGPATNYGLGGDGIFTIILALFAAFGFYGVRQSGVRAGANVALLVGGLAAAISGYDLIAVSSRNAGPETPDWGLYMAAASSLAIVVLAYMTRRGANVQAGPTTPTTSR